MLFMISWQWKKGLWTIPVFLDHLKYDNGLFISLIFWIIFWNSLPINPISKFRISDTPDKRSDSRARISARITSWFRSAESSLIPIHDSHVYSLIEGLIIRLSRHTKTIFVPCSKSCNLTYDGQNITYYRKFPKHEPSKVLWGTDY